MQRYKQVLPGMPSITANNRPGGLSAAQRAYWDVTFAKVVHSDGWKNTQFEHAWAADYRNSADTRRFLDGEYAVLRKTLVELGATK